MWIARWANSVGEKIFSARPKYASPPQGEPGEKGQGSFSIEVRPTVFDELHLRVSGTISMENAEMVRRELVAMIEAEPLRNVVLDLEDITYFDSSGAAIVMEVSRKCKELNNSFKLVNVAPTVQGFLKLVHVEQDVAAGILDRVCNQTSLSKSVRGQQACIIPVGTSSRSSARWRPRWPGI